MHDAGSVGPTFATWRHAQGCSFFLIRRAQSGKSSKRRTCPTRTTSGDGGPRRSCLHLPTTLHHAGAFGPPRAPTPALPTLPKSCPSRRSAIVPIGGPTQKAGLTCEDSAADRRAHSRWHLLVVEHDRAGWRSTNSLPRIGSRLKLRPFSLPNDSDAEGQQGRQWAYSA